MRISRSRVVQLPYIARVMSVEMWRRLRANGALAVLWGRRTCHRVIRGSGGCRLSLELVEVIPYFTLVAMTLKPDITMKATLWKILRLLLFDRVILLRAIYSYCLFRKFSTNVCLRQYFAPQNAI